ncbi:MAG: hypothetical protein AB1410_10895 [Acidobacteriota bacterium]
MASKKIFIFILLTMIILILIYNLYKYEFLFHHSLRYGDKIKKFEFKNPELGKVTLKEGQWNLIIVDRSLEEDYSLIRYINALFTKKFKDLGLNIILFSKSERNIAETFRRKFNILFPILSIKDNSNILKELSKLRESQRWILIIDPNLKVEFISDFIKDEDIRQLLEKYILGKISYIDVIKEEKLKVGDSFPPIEVINLESGEKKVITKDFTSSPHLWIIFTSNCISCALESHLLMWSLIEKNLEKKSNLSMGLIFSPYFNKEEIIFRVKKLNIQTPIFLAESELYNIEDTYYKRPYGQDDVIVIRTDLKNFITYSESLSTFLNHIKGGYLNAKTSLF